MIGTTRSRLVAVGLFSMLIAAPGGASEKGHREAHAHAHGHGKANIAVSGERLEIELEVPADDIVGFEKVAKTAKQKAAIEKAKALFNAHANIVSPSAEAGCKVAKTDIAYEVEGKHAEFHVVYAFQCANPARLNRIDFGYFKQFPRAKELDVGFVGAKGQKSFEVVPDKATIALDGLM